MLIGTKKGPETGDISLLARWEKVKINQTSTYTRDKSEAKDPGIVRAKHDVYKQWMTI